MDGEYLQCRTAAFLTVRRSARLIVLESGADVAAVIVFTAAQYAPSTVMDLSCSLINAFTADKPHSSIRFKALTVKWALLDCVIQLAYHAQGNTREEWNFSVYYLLSLLGGMMISVMVTMNGGLSERAGQNRALVIIHAVAFLVLAMLFLVKREKPLIKKLPLWVYCGGFIGMLITVFNNVAFGHISVTALLALALLGESVSGLLADHFGWFGLPVRRFRKEKLWGGLVALIGIIWMLDEFPVLPVAASLLAGIAVLFSRLINGRLARETNAQTSALFNYGTALSGVLLLYVFTRTRISWSIALSGPIYIYLGGAIGAIVVLLSNYIVGRISTFYMTLAMFVGQVTAGLLMDMALTQAFPARTAVGGLFVLAGLVLNLIKDRAAQTQQAIT